MLFFPVNFPEQFEICFTRSIWEVIKFYNVGDKSFETLITMGSFKESKFKLTCCAGQGLITIEVVMQKLKKVENFDC